jgi:hypothetical protein
MINSEKAIKGLEECVGNGNCTKCQYGKEKQALSCKKLLADTLALLKEQESIKQKMWNALYTEEDKLEKQYAGTDKNDDWFFVYRPWLQKGFEIAIEVIAKQEGQ